MGLLTPYAVAKPRLSVFVFRLCIPFQDSPITILRGCHTRPVSTNGNLWIWEADKAFPAAQLDSSDHVAKKIHIWQSVTAIKRFDEYISIKLL